MHWRRFTQCVLLLLAASSCNDATEPGTTAFVAPPSDSVFIGRSMRIVAISTIDSSVVTAAPYVWRTSDSAIAEASAGGIVFGMGAGTARVTGVLDGHGNSLNVRVVPMRATISARPVIGGIGAGRMCVLDQSARVHCRVTTSTDSLASLAMVGGEGDGTFTSLHVAPSHACALSTAGQLFCFGANNRGQLATGVQSAAATSSFFATTGTVRYSAISTGGTSAFDGVTCAIGKTDSLVYCVGGSSAAVTGRPPADSEPVLKPLASGLRASHIAVGRFHACAIGFDTRTYCWGSSSLGVTGTIETSTFTPQPILGAPPFETLSSSSHTCGLTADGAVYCWGSNQSGQLGIGRVDVDRHPEPIRFAVAGRVSSLAVGNGFTCVIANGELWCAGEIPVPTRFRAYLGARRHLPIRLAHGVAFRSIVTDVTRLCGITMTDELTCY